MRFLVLVILAAFLATGSPVGAEEAALPDWKSWKCSEFLPAPPFVDILEISACPLDNDFGAKFIYRPVGGKPFFIIWNYDDFPKVENPMHHAYAALEVGGRWVVGGRGKKYRVIEEPRGTLTFIIKGEDGSPKAKRVVQRIH